MCGITGWFSKRPQTETEHEILSRMVNALSHRGPDGQGTLIRTHMALGHTRLAVIDLKAGKQPMSYRKHLHIVFNGEIYNYRELMTLLKKKGHHFETHSDTEVILAMYDEYGLDAFSYLRGMFAISLWDESRNQGFLVRDTVGIKPLFYQLNHDATLLFASESKAILAYSGQRTTLNLQSLHLLMNYRYLPGNLSLFDNIQQLEPGTILIWNMDGSTRKQHFKHRPANAASTPIELLSDAIACNLTADVEVSAYLSGGIDSAAIVAIASQYLPQTLHTYTLNIGDDPRELENARRTAEIFGVPNHSMDTPKTGIAIERLIWHLEVPKINAMQVYQLAIMASKHTKVALSGLGGDELFLGYNAHYLMWQAQTAARNIPRFITRSLSSLGMAINQSLDNTPWTERSRAFRMLGSLNDWPRVYGLLRNIWDIPSMRHQVYGPRMLDEQLVNAFDYMDTQWPDEESPLAAMAKFEWRHKMVNDMLWQEDRCSMANSLEVRVPYLDSPLTEHIQSLPPEILMPHGKIKLYMRRLLSDLLPAEIINRKKSGFQVHAAEFFNSHLTVLADTYLSPEKVSHHGLFNPDFICMVRKLKPSVKYRWHFFMLYLMLTTHIWISLFEDNPQDGTIQV